MPENNFLIKDIANIVLPNISYSDKVYKITGLKCNPDVLPESLYFALSDNIFFKIPYITDQNTIIANNLQKNIMLVGKIISYFEIEEVEPNAIQSNNRINQNFESFIKPYAQKHFHKNNKKKWFHSIFKFIDGMIKSSGELPRNMGYIAKKITAGDIEKYLEFKRNNSLNELMEKFLLGKVTIGGKSKKNKPEESFPNSLKKFFIEMSNSYDLQIESVSKEISFMLSDAQICTDFIFTNMLVDLLKFREYNGDNDSAPSYSIPKGLHGDIDPVDTVYNLFCEGFKFTEENINLANDIARVFSNRGGKLSTNFDLGFSIFSSISNIIDHDGYNKLAKEMFSGVDLLNVDQYTRNDINGIYYIKELMLNSVYSYIESIDESKTGSVSEHAYTNRTSSIIFNKEPEMCVTYIGTKYKDMINMQWSEELTRTVTFSTRDLEESIRHRYFLTSVTGSKYLDQRNMVVDTMLPQSLFTSHMNLEKTNRTFQSSQNLNTKTAYAISPLTAAAYGCKQIPIEHLCRILGYTKDNIKSMMNTVKLRMFNFVFVGTGGTGNNTAIWLSRMLDMCNLPFLFNKVYAFEKEAAEIHNLLRFPKDPYTITIDTGIFSDYASEVENSKNKCHIIASELRSLSKETPRCFERYIANDRESNVSYPSIVFRIDHDTVPVLDENGEPIDFKTETIKRPQINTVFYGAPDINTRQNLSDVGNFISATHASNGCNIYINPEQDAMIQVESYGMIQLAPFFMNQLRMAIGLLEILSADNYQELLIKKDYEFLSYEFDGESKLKNDRVYNFKIISNPEMATENQAATTALDF